MPRDGWWSIYSEIDPRWNSSGETCWGTSSMAPAAQEHLDAMKAKYGEPPIDFEYSFYKY